MITTYPLARYRFDFEVTRALRLPEYAGSTLRGVFGRALRQLACVTRAKSCRDCLLQRTCPYPAIFEPPKPEATSLKNIATVPVPYVIEPPAWGMTDYAPGETLSFGFTLIGNTQQHLPLCIMSWQRAFARGVGVSDGTAELLSVSTLQRHDNGEEISILVYQPGHSLIDHPQQVKLPANTLPERITLQFETPLRLQHEGHALSPSKLNARTLLMALVRRTSLLAEIHAGHLLYDAATFSAMAEAASRIESKHNLIWRDWTRHSSRQQRTMQLGGCIGSWQLSGNLAPFKDVLWLGSWLHVGKEASFGLGKYHLLAHQEI
ncbi:CRISPR system precrRNA processing endoribonuclease RAMP protein Cas6 [Nitrosomonas communis]|uniref:Uncharacterized conserved protein n=1 Tax=Nitrosomonas communis TaxID=44574 RepID=A0A1I4RN85_9PROT|nr:CRISPR system precrRNA processing endoribonuclease RAMP protein Cas6 [Nitrosomonas communis]SFM53596.1 Uncharacterized conserved protein [Nitrosomonas communis]